MSLAKAREEAAKLRARISAGEDVIAERKQVLTPKQLPEPVLTFEQVAKQWLSERSRLNFWGDNVKGERRAFRILEVHAYPFIGERRWQISLYTVIYMMVISIGEYDCINIWNGTCVSDCRTSVDI